MTYRRDRSIRAAYDEQFHPEREIPYTRVANMGERRGEFNRPEEDYHRDFDYDGPRYYPNGGPRNYHGDEHRGYHDNSQFGNVRRNGPPSRREEGYHYYRGAREDVQGGRPEFRDEREQFRRKGSFPPQRDRSPLRRDVPPSPHSRSGSSVSNRSFSPEKKGLSLPKLHKSGKERAPGQPVTSSRDGSPQSSVSVSKVSVEKPSRPVEPPLPDPPLPEPQREKAGETQERPSEESETPALFEEIPGLEGDQEELPPSKDDAAKALDTLQERRSKAIAAKAREIEQVFRQDCETFGMVVKMLVAKDPALEGQLQTPLRENLGEIQQRCLEDLRHFISELDEVLQPERSG
ncbi:periphilin-1-like isoform X4 [Conger conger]|uniref:periphilin-1-like isoform X4 n=1 Tax=Conger conger TaxID=82655 RepID=UPI002A5A6CE0|nr:periphilin-1-like isoform X4 [Conger conger]